MNVSKEYETLFCILGVLGIIFGCIFIPIYAIMPISMIYILRQIYDYKFIPEMKEKYNNKIITISIILGKEILSFVFIFWLFAFHFIFPALFFPIFMIVILIRNKIYKLPICSC